MRQFIFSGYRLFIEPLYVETTHFGDDLSISDYQRTLELNAVCQDEKETIDQVKEYFSEVGRI